MHLLHWYYMHLIRSSKAAFSESEKKAYKAQTVNDPFIGSIIGWQGQEHKETVDAIWHTHEFHLYIFGKF